MARIEETPHRGHRTLILIVVFGLTMIAGYLLFFRRTMRTAIPLIDPTRFGEDCRVIESCNDIVAVGCGAERGRPLLYVQAADQQIIEYCGGYCDRADERYCRQCPPAGWTCPSTPRF